MIRPRSSGHSAKRVISKAEVNNETKKESTASVVRNKYTVQFMAVKMASTGQFFEEKEL
jgi:hypothetical protein